MSKAKKIGIFGAGLGFSIALVLSGFAYYSNSHHLGYNLEKLYLILAPTSILLMATEKATPSAQIMVVLIFAVTNALIYAIVLYIIGKILDAISN